jgi:glycosyltransferase involved in cell wall biosynthesis
MKLSILMPVYNEKKWLPQIVEKVLQQKIGGINDMELLIVNDGSTDGTAEVLKELTKRYAKRIRVFAHQENRGKGASIQTAVKYMTGDICIIQDADMEYDPADYPLILEPIISNRADCVYGSRFAGTQPKRVLFFWHYVGNKFLTLLSNMLTNINLTDMETCYKAFRADVLKSIPIRSERFGFEPEITAKIARRKLRIYEVGIGYHGRTYQEGKKITWKDGLQALGIILKYWIVDDSRKEPDAR